MKELIIATGFDIRSGNILYDEVPCGIVFKQKKDEFQDNNGHWQEPKSICGETFDKEGKDYCPKCSQASSKANSEDQE